MPKPSRDHRQHNYVRKVEEFTARLQPVPGRVYPIEVAHDGWCAIYRGGFCDCDPEVRLAAGAESPEGR